VKEELSFGAVPVAGYSGGTQFFPAAPLNAGQYDRTLEERMPFIVEDILETVEEAGTDVQMRDRILGAVEREVESLLEQPLVRLPKSWERTGNSFWKRDWKLLFGQEGSNSQQP
jgi:hypothetical protein